jgi:hypothetical protein
MIAAMSVPMLIIVIFGSEIELTVKIYNNTYLVFAATLLVFSFVMTIPYLAASALSKQLLLLALIYGSTKDKLPPILGRFAAILAATLAWLLTYAFYSGILHGAVDYGIFASDSYLWNVGFTLWNLIVSVFCLVLLILSLIRIKILYLRLLLLFAFFVPIVGPLTFMFFYKRWKKKEEQNEFNF